MTVNRALQVAKTPGLHDEATRAEAWATIRAAANKMADGVLKQQRLAFADSLVEYDNQ